MKMLHPSRIAPLLALLLTGCYDFPLDPSPQVAVDPVLIGTWRCLPIDASEDEAPATWVIASSGAHEYAVTTRETDKKPEYARAYLSTLSIQRLLNVQTVEDGKAKNEWYFVRYTVLRPGILHFQYVEDNYLKGSKGSTVALRRALEKQRKNPALFADFCICVRAKEK